MKLIDKYILKHYFKSFGKTFVVLMLIFFFHTIWLFIQELAGKDVGVINILKFLFYYTPSLAYITLPLAVIVSSITTFGALSENYEFVALKSSGISINRALRSVIIFMLSLSLFTFYIANNVIPVAEYNNYKFQYTISTARPSLAIVAGVFSDLGKFSIKVDEKYGENDRYLKNIIIHKVSEGKNTVVIKAKNGELYNDKSSDFVQLILKEGYYYEDVNPQSGQFPYAKSYFDKYTINMDLSYLNAREFDENIMVSNSRMMDYKQLSKTKDSMYDAYKETLDNFKKHIYKQSMVDNLNIKGYAKNITGITIDSLLQGVPKWSQNQIVGGSLSAVKNLHNLIDSKREELFIKKRNINKYIISIHDKFSLAFACLILFFIGAPLGAIIKKGGIGMPMVMAIVLFLSYYFIGMLSKNIAEDDTIDPILSSWIADIIMLPLGIWFTYRATYDKNIKLKKHLIRFKSFVLNKK